MLSKALEMGVCFHTGPAFGEHGGALLGNMKGCFWGIWRVLLGNMEGCFFLGLLREKKIIQRNFCVDFEI